MAPPAVMDRLNAALADRYSIERELGEGGMAMVYLADDLRHERKVALKVLRPDLAAVVGAERFLAEIKTTANLQHPHILPLFDSGEVDGFLFFVMPFIDGETLQDRLEREKQLPVDEAVGIAMAVASALAAAHEAGVIHRDIKPANILLSRGEPLVTDFGIAIAVTKSSGARLTETGLSVGTPFYMSPEQATGDREITAASDVYALGCVLYEMLVGEPPYVGNTAQAVLGKILTEKPRAPTAVRAAVPPNVEGAVLKALEKLPADRFTSATGLVRALEDSSFRYGEEAAAATTAGAGSATWKRATLALAGISVVLLALVLRPVVFSRPTASPVSPVLELDPGDRIPSTDVAISKDGTMFAVAAAPPGGTSKIWVRRIDESDFRPLAGTDNAAFPDFSPDGKWIVYRDEVRNALVKVAIAGGGGLPILAVDSISPYDPHWGEDGTIVFTGPSGLWRISATGQGQPHLLSRNLIRPHPQLLPDGSGVLAGDTKGIYVIETATDSARLIIPDGDFPTWVGEGDIVFIGNEGGLFAIPFDLRHHEVTGERTPILQGIASGGVNAGYSVSKDGTLVFLEGSSTGVLSSATPDRRFLFEDRKGHVDTVRLTPRFLTGARISPNGRYIAYGTRLRKQNPVDVIQVLDLETGSSPEVASVGDNDSPVWSPDSRRIAFSSTREGTEGLDIFVVPANGSGKAQRVVSRPAAQRPVAWPRDSLLVMEDHLEPSSDLWLLPLQDGAPIVPYLRADYDERNLAVSPDGTLAAYESSETGSREVYVRGFPEPRGKWRISTGEGARPRWARDGRTLYYWHVSPGADSLFAVPVKRSPDFVPGEPSYVLSGAYDIDSWDVGPDGRFLLTQNVGNPAEPGDTAHAKERYLVVLNWFDELRRKMAATGGGGS